MSDIADLTEAEAEVSEISIQLYDDSQGEDSEPVVDIYSSLVPRRGDLVRYWVDFPGHKAGVVLPRVPIRITGTVARVEIEYRHMVGWGSHAKTKAYALVYLSDYREDVHQEGQQNDQIARSRRMAANPDGTRECAGAGL